jgi:DNA adenine methylase
MTSAQCRAPDVFSEPLMGCLPYFGGKRTMAPGIAELIRARTGSLSHVKLYVEPFHGSAAVLFALREQGYKGAATICDTDLLNHLLVMHLADEEMAWRLYTMLEGFTFSERVFQLACETLASWRGVNKDDLIAAKSIHMGRLVAAYLVASWMGRNGEAGIDKPWLEQVKGFCVRWTQSGGDPSVRWLRVVQSVPVWHQWLRDKTTYLHRDALEVLADVPDQPGTVIYVDPPYIHATRGTTRYRQDVEDHTDTMFEEGDFHDRLAMALERFRHAMVIVSYYAHERLLRLYPRSVPGREGWTHVDCSTHKALSHTSGRGESAQAREVLIVRKGGV